MPKLPIHLQKRLEKELGLSKKQPVSRPKSLVRAKPKSKLTDVCIACNGTGISSSGKPCVPCELRKRKHGFER